MIWLIMVNYVMLLLFVETLLKFINAMEKLQFDYSYKNIPIPTERNYKSQLMEKTELVIKRMRWKAHFYNEKKDAKEMKPKRYPKLMVLNLEAVPLKLKNQFSSKAIYWI